MAQIEKPHDSVEISKQKFQCNSARTNSTAAEKEFNIERKSMLKLKSQANLKWNDAKKFEISNGNH